MMKIFNFCASHISLGDSSFALRAQNEGEWRKEKRMKAVLTQQAESKAAGQKESGRPAREAGK